VGPDSASVGVDLECVRMPLVAQRRCMKAANVRARLRSRTGNNRVVDGRDPLVHAPVPSSETVAEALHGLAVTLTGIPGSSGGDYPEGLNGAEIGIGFSAPDSRRSWQIALHAWGPAKSGRESRSKNWRTLFASEWSCRSLLLCRVVLVSMFFTAGTQPEEGSNENLVGAGDTLRRSRISWRLARLHVASAAFRPSTGRRRRLCRTDSTRMET